MDLDTYFLISVIGLSMLGIVILISMCVVASREDYNQEGVYVPVQLQYDEAFENNDLPIVERIKAWIKQYPPILEKINPLSIEITPELVLIRDRGIQAFRFVEWGPDVNVNEQTALLDQTQAPFLVNESFEVEFNSFNTSSSSILNLPVPVQNRRNDTTYFEVKILNFTDVVYIGIGTMPWPNWGLPGIIPYSISVNSNGELLTNGNFIGKDEQLPQLLPKLQRGDVIGIGVRFTTGSIFITHNGRNMMEILKGVKFNVYPIIGARSRAKLSVNIGQMGFVFIEANVKKWGFCENQNDGQLGAPPLYGSNSGDMVLDKGEELPPKYPEQGFFDQ